MAFDLSKYNLQPFNVGGQRVRWIAAAASEKVTAQIGTGTLTYIFCSSSEQVFSNANGAQGRFFKAHITEVISELVEEAQMSVLVDAIANEIVSSEAEQAAEIRPVVVSREAVNAEAGLGSNSYLAAEADETIQPDVILGSKIYPAAEMYELVNAAASSLAIDTRVCIISTTLKPGQRLVIDASTYNVLLDSQNAIHLHSGEWIDELNRETTEINVSAQAGAANLTASILYTERYL